MDSKEISETEPNLKYKWTKEKTFTLIAAVASNQNLWGTAGRSANQQQRQDGWAEVSRKFNSISAAQCQTKWQSLRTQQRRIVRSGASNTTNWTYFAQLPPLHDADNNDASATSVDTECSRREYEPVDEWTHFGELVAWKLRGIVDQKFAHLIKDNIDSYLSSCLPQVINIL